MLNRFREYRFTTSVHVVNIPDLDFSDAQQELLCHDVLEAANDIVPGAGKTTSCYVSPSKFDNALLLSRLLHRAIRDAANQGGGCTILIRMPAANRKPQCGAVRG